MNLKNNKNLHHSFFMNLALQQARKCLGNTKSNPAVGCVIVKNNYIIGAGSTGANGTPHAEVNAINSIKKNIKSSDLYVSLEPCSHYGKTPPCVKSIINNKIKRVFFSIKDPDIRSYNKSTSLFKKNKIISKNGFLFTETRNFYRSYYKYKKDKLPFVTGKMAVSNDFYTESNRQKWITNKFSRGRVHLLRSSHDSILTSVKTVINDNPLLTCRIPGLEKTSPTRIILDKNLRIPLSSNICTSSNKIPTIIFYNKIDKSKIAKLKNLNIRLIKSDLDIVGNFNLKSILFKIKLLGFSRIFLETGIELTHSFLKENLVNDFKLFVSKKKVGSYGSNKFKECMKLFLLKKKINYEKINLLGDKLFSYKIK